MGFPCSGERELHYSGSAIKKQEGRHLDPGILTSTIGRHNEGRKPMLRAILIATAVLCMSQAASAQELTAEQRSACMATTRNIAKASPRAADASSPASPRRATRSRRPA